MEKGSREWFEREINKLPNERIVELIERTWHEPTGELFREIGFDVLEDRVGSTDVDELYSELWAQLEGEAA